MKKLFYLTLILWLNFPNYLFSQYNTTSNQAPFTVVIDAGHGGKDSGALGSQCQEKDLALKIALRLGLYIQTYSPEIKVLYTRTKDVFVPLHERTAFANEQRADVFLSIHCNALANDTKGIRGTETYVMGSHDTDENLAVAQQENQAVLLEQNYQIIYGGYDPNSTEGRIILSMFQNAHLSQSILLAEKIEKQFQATAKRKSRGVKQAGFVVLRNTSMPSVLIETGFLTHSKEQIYLNSAQGQNYISFAIYKALAQYKKMLNDRQKLSWRITEKNPLAYTNTRVEPVAANGSIIFSIQLASSPYLVDTKQGIWGRIPQIECKKIGNQYKYLVGKVRTLAEATQLQTYWRKNGFNDAFVVAFRGGERVALTEVF